MTRTTAALCVSMILGAFACGDASDNTRLLDGRHNAPQNPVASADPTLPDPPAAADPTSTTIAPPAPAPDSGTPPPPPPPSADIFAGAPAFVSQIAGSTHNAGQNCMGGCHNHGFTFAGTLTDGAGNGVVGAEVRLVDANGKAISVYTGTNGNFHSSSAFVAPAKVAARNATTTVIMTTAIAATSGGCNGCHATGGTQTPIHLP